MEMGNGILRQHCNIVGVNQLRNPMVHLRVNMVRASGKDDAPVAGTFQVFNSFLALLFHIFPTCVKLSPCRMYGRTDICCRDGELFGQFFHQAIRNRLLTFQGQERMDKVHLAVYDGVDIVLDILRVGGNDGAVIVVIGVFKFLSLIRDTGIENPMYSLVD